MGLALAEFVFLIMLMFRLFEHIVAFAQTWELIMNDVEVSGRLESKVELVEFYGKSKMSARFKGTELCWIDSRSITSQNTYACTKLEQMPLYRDSLPWGIRALPPVKQDAFASSLVDHLSEREDSSFHALSYCLVLESPQ